MQRSAGVVSMLAGAVSTVAGALLLGWPGLGRRGDLVLAGTAVTLAAAALVVVPVLLVVASAVAAAQRSDLPRDRLLAAGADADGGHRRSGELLDPVHVGLRGGR
jgi:hypothetical protein